uniref:Small ribosomal subunit protein uS3m n=1 Tax=Torulaspora quercuum TaxID=1143185 RepID=A0A2D0W3Q2_9SACH|nr:ribosomal protein S3 [Torulaspora quercuum]APD15054.1 ribosomal protein S3 [Torulaspora quercuum]ATV99304.1 ribosomal protein S3 [Torulaspora quercuum]
MKNINLLKLLNNKLYNNNDKHLLLKTLLLELNKMRLSKNIINNKNINKYMNELNNKGNKLQHINNMNNWTTQIYNYNKNMEITTTMKDKLLIKLLYKFMTLKLNMNNMNFMKKIIISKPIFQHTINNLNIKFYYYNLSLYNNNNTNNNNYNKYYMNMVSKMMNLLNNNNNNLSKILSYYYKKKVTIEPIKLSYNYLNSDIFSKCISMGDINKYNNGIKNEYSRLLNNTIPKLNDQTISMNYINNIKYINKLKYNNIINNMNNNLKNTSKGLLNINNIYNNMNIYNIPMNILMFKYLTGWSITFNGRLSTSKSISRSETQKVLVGTFRNKNYLWSNINNMYKLNYISANHNLSNMSNINKNGKYNIKVKLNYI